MPKKLTFFFSLVLAMGLAGSVPAEEDIAFDANSGDFADSSWTLSWPHTIGSGQNRILIVGVAGEDDSDSHLVVDSIKYNDINMSMVTGSSKSVITSGYRMKTELYYLLAPPSGSGDIVVTYSGEITRICGGGISLENVAQQPAEAVVTSSVSSAKSISTDITTQTNGAWVIDVVGSGGVGSFTATAAGMTKQYDTASGSSTGAGSTKTMASAGVTTMSWWHPSTNRMTHSVAAFAPVDLNKANNPRPGHLTIDVAPNVELSWNAGENAESHDVYFGTVFDDVRDANNTWPVGTSAYKGSQAIDANSYDPGILESEQVYYWRVDEVNSTDPNIWQGSIWSFTVEEYIAADFTGDGIINNNDIWMLTNEWLDTGPDVTADADFDDKVDLKDYAIVANAWEPFIPNECDDWQLLHPDWILCEDFETRDISTLLTYWTDMRNNADALTISSEVPPSSPGSRSLQITAKRGLNTGGQISKAFPVTYDELYARFYVKFAYDYGYNHHFCKLGTVMGGGAGQLPVNKFWTGLEPTTKLGHYYPATYYPPLGFWHFYTYWPHMKSWQTPEGEPDGRDNPYYGNNFAPQVPTFTPRDEWICVEFMIRVNSNPADPENSDGVQRFWINGELIGDWSPGTPIGYWYRDTFRLAPEDSRSGPFEGYRWRDESWVKLQFFKLENYVSEGVFQTSEDYKNANPGFIINDQEATCWFDHVVVATSYIGPIYQE